MESTKPNKKLTNFEAFLHLLKTTLGGGFLAMPQAFCHAGIALGSLGIVIIGAAVLNMMSFLVRVSRTLRSGKYAVMIAVDRQERGKGDVPAIAAAAAAAATTDDPDETWLPPMSYPETVGAVFRYGARGRFAHLAPFFRTLTSTMLLCTYYGVNIVYVCIISNTLKQLVDQHMYDNNLLFDLPIRYYPTIVSLAVFPIGMVASLKALVIISKVANTMICTAAFIILYFLSIGDDRPIQSHSKMVVYPVSGWSLFAGTSLCSLEGIGMLLKIENNMEKPKQLAGSPTYVLHSSMIMIIFINTLVGILGYMRYGDNVSGSISLNLPPESNLAVAVKILVALGILLSYGLQLNVTADLVWPLAQRMVNFFKPGFLEIQLRVDAELAPEQDANVLLMRNRRRSKLVYIAMRFTLILGTIIVATIEPRIEPLISLVGAVGFSILGLIVPILMETVWYWYPVEEENNVNNDLHNLTAAETKEPTDAMLGCFDINAPTNGVGLWSIWAAIRGGSTVTTGTRSAVMAKTTSTWKHVKRIVRCTKNGMVLALAMFALVGGSWFNIQQIASGMFGDGDLKPTM